MLQISRRAAQIAPSATLAIDTRAKALKAEGRDVVGFGAGEPDFDTPEYVRAAAQRAIDEGVPAQTIWEEGLRSGMDIIGEKFKRNEVFVPEVLRAAGAMN